MEEVLEQEAGLNAGVAADSFSEDVWLAVLKHVDWQTLASASQTCKFLHDVTSFDSLWQPQWQAEFAKSQSYRLSSNAMGGCALQLQAEPRQEAARAFQLLGAPAESRGLPTISCAPHTAAHITACPDRQGTVGWKELFRKSREVDRGWQTGHSTSEPLEGHNDFIRCVQLAGDTLVSCSGSVSHQDCSIRVWDLVTNTCKQVLRGHMGPIWCMVYEPTLNRIASGADDYSVRYWDSVSGNSVFLEDPDSAVRCIHMDSSARQLVAGTEFGQLLLWDMDALEEVLSAGVDNVVQHYERLDEARGNPRPLVVTGPGAGAAAARRAVTLLDGRHVEVDGSNHVRVADALDEGKAISAIQIQGGLCASTSIEPPSRIQLWDVSGHSWRLASTIGDAEMQYANSMSFDKDLNRMVAGCGDRNVRVWDLSTGTRLHVLSGHTDEVHAHQFDERTVASCSLGGEILVWDMRSGHCRHTLQHRSAVHTFQFDGDRLVSGTWDGGVCLWDLRRGSIVKEWNSHYGRVWSVALDRYRIASAGCDSLINVRSFVPQQQQDHSAVASPSPDPTAMMTSRGCMGPSDSSRTLSVMMDLTSSAEADDEEVASSRSTMLSTSSREGSAM